MTSYIKPGAKARLTADTPEGWHEPARKGFEFTVEEYVPAAQEGDSHFGDEDAIQVAFYYGNSGGGVNNVCVPADVVEEAMSPEAMRARGIPSILEASEIVANALSSAFGRGADITETEVSGDEGSEYVYAYGRTGEGLGFGMRVAVTEVFRTDD